MSSSERKTDKKLLKQKYKLEKKKQKSALQAGSVSPASPYLRFAESTKGVLYIILAVSIVVAVFMGQPGFIVTLEDIIDKLIIARAGKGLIIVIAVALFLYGLKNLRILK